MQQNINDTQIFKENLNCAIQQTKKYPEIIRYLTSFTAKDGFENKQFDRYVEKVKNMLRDMLPGFLPTKIRMYSVKQMLLQMLAYYHMTFESEEITQSIEATYGFMHSYMIKSEKLNFAEELMNPDLDTKAVEQIIGIERETFSVGDCIEYELRAACKEFIRKKAALLSDVDKASYFATLPKNQIELLEIVQNTLAWTSIDLERSLRSSIRNALISSKQDEFINQLHDKLNTAQDELAEKDIKIQKLKQTIARLSSETEVRNNYANCISDTTEYSEALKRENQKLRIRYNNLLDKYSAIKEEMLNVDDSFDDTLILPELDITKRYLFVMGNNAGFQLQISEAFQNAKFINKEQSIGEMEIECVIAITSHISHRLYLNIKSQCKSQNIPFIHCEHSNVDLIKQLLINTLY